MVGLCQLLMMTVLAACCIEGGVTHNILYLAPVTTKSHMAFFGEIIKTLADRGHQFTVVTSYDAPKHPNVTEVHLHLPIDKIMPNTFENRGFSTQLKMMQKLPDLCIEALGRKAVQQIDVDMFDLIYFAPFMADCFYSLIENTSVPVITTIPNTIFTILHDQVGNVDFPSFVTAMGLSTDFPLTTTQRFINTLATSLSSALTPLTYWNPLVSKCKKSGFCHKNMKSIAEIQTKTSLIFINSVRSLENPARPYVPAVIHAGGMNCRPAKPLPQDLESWIEGAGEDGFIYLSLGTAVIPSDMPEEFRRIFVSVLGSLSQRVLWKWDQETMEDLPKNVKLAKWVSQQDILGHPKLKLFISHGGMFSTLESTYHQVPILGMPVFGDQITNIDKVVSEGWGEVMLWDELTEDLFKYKINMVIKDKSYKEMVQHRSVLMRDQPMSPQDTVVYWTEYVIRHKGAPHMRSPFLDMSWREVYNMDVWASLLALIGVVLALLAWMIRAIVRRCCRTKRKLE